VGICTCGGGTVTVDFVGAAATSEEALDANERPDERGELNEPRMSPKERGARDEPATASNEPRLDDAEDESERKATNEEGTTAGMARRRRPSAAMPVAGDMFCSL